MRYDREPPVAVGRVRLAQAPFISSNCFDPNVQAHMSALSEPRLLYQAFNWGSVLASSNSWAITESIPSTPAFPLGPVDCIAQELRQRFALPTKEYLMLAVLRIVP